MRTHIIFINFFFQLTHNWIVLYVYVYMYVCMYVYIVYVYIYCVCVHVCMYVLCTYVCVYVRMYVCMYLCMYCVCMYVCMYVSVYVWMLVCMYVCICVCMYLCMCVYVNVCMHVALIRIRIRIIPNSATTYTNKVKVEWSRYRLGVAQRVGRGIALLFHDRGTRRGKWSAARPGRTLPPGKTRYPFYRSLGGPQGRSGLAEILVPTGIWSRIVQPVAQSQYQLSYPAHTPTRTQ